MKSPLDVLQYLKTVLRTFEYECIKDCVLEFDHQKQNIRQLQKNPMSESLTHSRCCTVVFAGLQKVLYEGYEFAMGLQTLQDIAEVIEDEMAQELQCEKYAGVKSPGQESPVKKFESATQSESGELLAHDKCEPGSVREGKYGGKLSGWQQKIRVIKKQEAGELRCGKNEICQENTQLRFAMAYTDLNQMVKLALREHGNSECHELFDAQSDLRDIESCLDESVLIHTVYSKFKNEVLVGAVVKFTKRVQQSYEDERRNTRVRGETVGTVVRMRELETTMQQDFRAIHNSSRRNDSKRDKFVQAHLSVMKEDAILRDELARVQKMITDMKPLIQESSVILASGAV